MPFISKQRLYNIHLPSGPQYKADVALLLMAIRLITLFPPENPKVGLYPLAKYHYFRIEGSTAASIPILQANILIALYKLGHGIYPAAYLTIGSCARYMGALGINRPAPRRASMGMPRAMSLIEVEERKRVWWAIVILDRFVSVASPSRPFATPDPGLDDALPSDDEDWDNGFIHTISSRTPRHTCRFRRLCQAARVLGEVISLPNRSGSTSGPMNENDKMTPQLENLERMRLDSILQSMLDNAIDLEDPDLDTMTFIFSTMIGLYTPHLSAAFSTLRSTRPPTYEDPPTRASEIVNQITEAILSALLDQPYFTRCNPRAMSPWRAYFMYHALSVQMATLRDIGPQGDDEVLIYMPGMYGERQEVDLEKVILAIRQAFTVIGARWSIGNVYLRLLEAQEALDATV
ncbi:hypothetical protein BJX63DRAFT_399573 [Aspergillus granulosus]|uniref:Xylanolytic transcriptional activator regulatory domain-containing protein n=1 Tax=Aspergillus granulosus TaxID=176169 RepID=A0ABR4H734_9EURO